MRPVSAAFQAAIRRSHQIATRAAVVAPDGTETEIPIVDGTITLDQTAAIRGRCDVTLVDDGTLGLVPTSAASALAPYGNELRIARGITYPDGTTELVQLGVFRIQVTDVEDAPGGLQIRVAGLDRAQRIADARFEDAYQVAAGTNCATAILAAFEQAWPGIEADLAVTAFTTPTVNAQEGDDRWKFGQDIAVAVSMRLYFDGDGVLRLAPDVITDAVETLAEGEGGVLVQAGREWSREGSSNGVIATGESTDLAAPARGSAFDLDPGSPTYYFGPFGKVPMFYSSPLLITNDQAAAAAQTLLLKQLGTTESVSFGSFVLPHLEPGDTVRIKRERSGINEDHIIDKVTIPLAATGTMTGGTRAWQVTT